jgi:hydrogenase/urease accessory protein HupE
MRDDQKPHPGPWRVPQVDSGIAGVVIAAGFLVLALVSMPTLAPVFLFGAVPLGMAVALLLRFTNPRR